MVRQEAWRQDVIAGFGTYSESVRIALHEDGEDAKLSPHDRRVVEMGFIHGVGPRDCACQIVADRADAEEAAKDEAALGDGIPVISKHGDRETI